jgi:hypothetical protein
MWQQAQRGFLHGAFTGVWVRRFLGVGLLVFLCQCDACGRGKRDESYESTGFQDATREWLRRVMAIVIKRPDHIIHVTPMQRAIPGDWYEFLGICANTDISASCSLATRCEAVKRGRSKTLEAPPWLWSSVVSLIGRQEIAYLERCRKHATQVQA